MPALAQSDSGPCAALWLSCTACQRRGFRPCCFCLLLSCTACQRKVSKGLAALLSASAEYQPWLLCCLLSPTCVAKHANDWKFRGCLGKRDLFDSRTAEHQISLLVFAQVAAWVVCIRATTRVPAFSFTPAGLSACLTSSSLVAGEKEI